MKRFNVFALSLMVVAFALSTGNTIAQQTSLKQQLVGAWELVSCERTTAKGAPQPYCVNSIGILMFDASGRYAHIIGASGRPKITTFKRSDVPAEEYKAVAEGFLANFGTWSVNERDGTVTRHYLASMLPNYEGTDNKSSVKIVGDELTLENPNPRADQDHERSVNVYRRVK
jgi:lipocalin-like protein